MARILVVEDNDDVRSLVRAALEPEGHTITELADGLSAKRLLLEQDGAAAYDLVILDLMLPHVDGSVILARLRGRSRIPVIVLSAKSAVFTKVDLLRLGADDYITKPFDLAELAARVEVALRHRPAEAEARQVLSHGPLTLDVDAAAAALHGRPVPLTGTELRILRLFLEDPGRVRSRRALHEHVWEEPFAGDDSSLKTHISNLRRHLREADAQPECPSAPAPCGGELIETVWGLGYRLRVSTES